MKKQTLLVDVGGTNVRFAVYDGAVLSDVKRYQIKSFSTFIEAAQAALNHFSVPVSRMIIGAAGLRHGDSLSLTNYTWEINQSEIAQAFSLEKVVLVNDFSLQGLGILDCASDSFVPLGNVFPETIGPRAIIGAGTGLGVCFLVPDHHGRYTVLESEGGHTTIGSVSRPLALIAQKAMERLPHLSFERLVSGQGLLLLYQTIGENYNAWQDMVLFDELVKMKQAYSFVDHQSDSQWIPVVSAPEVTALAQAGNEIALMTFWFFFQYLGVFCANMALTLKTTGGVFLVGDLLMEPFVRSMLEHSRIRQAFETKGRFKEFLKVVPLILVCQKDIPFAGLKYLAQEDLVK